MPGVRLLPSSSVASPMQTFCPAAAINGVGNNSMVLTPVVLHPSLVVTSSDMLYCPGTVYGMVACCAEERDPFPKFHFHRALVPTSTVEESRIVKGLPVRQSDGGPKSTIGYEPMVTGERMVSEMQPLLSSITIFTS